MSNNSPFNAAPLDKSIQTILKLLPKELKLEKGHLMVYEAEERKDGLRWVKVGELRGTQVIWEDSGKAIFQQWLQHHCTDQTGHLVFYTEGGVTSCFTGDEEVYGEVNGTSQIETLASALANALSINKEIAEDLEIDEEEDELELSNSMYSTEAQQSSAKELLNYLNQVHSQWQAFAVAWELAKDEEGYYSKLTELYISTPDGLYVANWTHSTFKCGRKKVATHLPEHPLKGFPRGAYFHLQDYWDYELPQGEGASREELEQLLKDLREPEEE